MRICLILLSALLMQTSCSQNNKIRENLESDSSQVNTSSLDSTSLNKVTSSLKTADTEFGTAIDSYLINNDLDTSAFQLIATTCAIIMTETEKQTTEREERERESFLAEESIARKAWENQPHDSTESFPGYFPGYEGDGEYFYENAKEIFNTLNIKLVTAKPKNYIRLMGRDRKFYTLDIRTNMTPEWTIILFHIDKTPVVVEAMDITEDKIKQHFLGR